MPLKIQLKPKERVIINGAVIEGHADVRSEIVVLNNASVMRQKHILQQDEANTPVKRMYFALQMLYIEDRENHAPYKESFAQFHKDLEDTLSLPIIKTSLELIKQSVSEEKYYDSLKVCRELIKVEAELFKYNNPMEDDDEEHHG